MAAMPPAGHAASLLFRESAGYLDFIGAGTLPGWDHVGLEVDGWVWESHPGYDYPGAIFQGILPHFAWDPDEAQHVSVPFESGVQRHHTAGSFRWNSHSRTVSPTPPGGFAAAPIDPVLAANMEFEILLESGSGYPSVSNPFNFTSAQQKGAGGQFTCVGLIEYAAEAAGLNCGEGFVPNALEVVPLTPQLMHWAASNPAVGQLACVPQNIKRWLSGFFDPVDFVLTDPLGRRVGYSAATGHLAEIPEMLYTGDSAETESLVILQPLSGAYHIELTGLGDNATVDIRDGMGNSVFTFDGFLATGQTVASQFTLVTAPLAGDFQEDGDVDADDLAAWGAAFGLAGAASHAQGDADGDQDVDGADFLVWQQQFTAAAAGAVPEPHVFVLVLCAFAASPRTAARARRARTTP
ncbi:MAG: hypothetical protein DCC67_12265 [Planctomycetota bacterium]|nr:MAG: hypothetical protein DCC67_12265 [Planctomycetota bacterium]